jgi:5-formyltetrahydrofolate cyclo-ligase
MPDKNVEKSELRRRLLAERRALATELRTAWDQAIANRISMLLQERPSRSLAVYWPICGEPDLRDAYADWHAAGMRLALPVVIDKQTPLKFVSWTPGEELQKDAMGVAVPENGQIVQPDSLLLPCVGFNGQRVRLGYGGGLYDRTLEGPDRPLAIGVAYFFSHAEFASEAHDVALDCIVTECAVIE